MSEDSLNPWLGDPWWEAYWDRELCPNGDKETAELRLWALEFYGLSGVEAPLDYLREARTGVDSAKVGSLSLSLGGSRCPKV